MIMPDKTFGEETKCLVYLLTNLVTEKWYVGKTNRPEPVRWRGHLDTAKAGASYAISRSIRKHGPDNFDRQIIAQNLTWDEASNLERIWILLLQSHKSEFGYNLTLGGDGVRHNEETRHKVSESLKGHPVSAESRQKMGASSIKKFSEYSAEEGDFSFRKDIPNKDVVEMYESGMSTPQIAKHFSTDHSCILTRLKRMGVCRRPVKGPRTRLDLIDEELISRYQSGESTIAIAKSLGTTHETIRKRFKTAGVVLRTRSQANIVRYNKPAGDAAISNQEVFKNE